MCLAKVYLNQEGKEPIMQEISRIRFDGEHIRMENLFGEGKVVTGRVREIDFMASRVVLEGSEAEKP